MEYVGIDLHKVHTQICVIDEEGTVLREARISTDAEKFVAFFGERPPARILLEASGMSEWAARVLEGIGIHEVVVGDPGYALMYGARNRKVKTDARDARALAEASRLGMFRRSYRSTDAAMRMRRRLSVRRALVESRANLIRTVQGLSRQLGLKLPTGSAEKFGARLLSTDLPSHFLSAVGPILASLEVLNEQISYCDQVLARVANESKATQLLMTVPGVGPITAATFASILGDPQRFDKADQVQAYLGLVPREYSSGEVQRRGRITKAGNSYLRVLLVQAALRIMRYRPPAAQELWEWAIRIGARRGKNIARVALARRLAGVMFAMLRDDAPFTSRRRDEVLTAA